MVDKELIRKKYLIKRKKNYFKIRDRFFYPLIKLFKTKNIRNLALYHPVSCELDILKIFDIEFFKKTNFLLPKMTNKVSINFYEWKKKDVLNVNKYGIPEPIKSKPKTPNAILVPMLAFDKYKNRLGYGKGFYDRFFQKNAQNKRNILSIGVAFSFQRYHNLPVNNKDVKLDYILTEKGIF